MFLYEDCDDDVEDELYVADTTVLERPVYEEIVEDLTIDK
jgi:hypothetical protein